MTSAIDEAQPKQSTIRPNTFLYSAAETQSGFDTTPLQSHVFHKQCHTNQIVIRIVKYALHDFQYTTSLTLE